MSKITLKPIIIASIISFFPLSLFAADNLDEVFQTECNKAWMTMSEGTSDTVAYKNFGEKYCGCASGKPLDTKEQLHKASQICMSQTLLHDTMDSLEGEGLKNLTAEKIQTGCMDKWNIIYPKMDEHHSASVKNYCQCASSKLADLNDNSDELTDKEWYVKIDSIAAECSGNVEPDKATTEIKKGS